MHARMFEFEGSLEEIDPAVALMRDEILPLERPGQAAHVEVYSPDPGLARRLVVSGAVRPL